MANYRIRIGHPAPGTYSAAAAQGSYALTGQNATLTKSTGGSGVLFAPDLGLYSTPSDVWTVNNNGATFSLQSTVTRPGGQSKALRIGYDLEDDGVELYVPTFAATQSLYTRWYMMLDSNWAGHWPVGLKTNRYFTNVDYRVVVADPGAEGDVYMSSKFIWNRYPADGGDPTSAYCWGLNHACNNMEIPTEYPPATNFGNGLPYIRPDHWYKLEIWQVLNSALNAADGVLQCWVDDVQVFNRTDWPWASTGSSNPGGQNRSCTTGLTGWRAMWFGGNISANGGFGPTGTLYRYEDGHYLSTTLDR